MSCCWSLFLHAKNHQKTKEEETSSMKLINRLLYLLSAGNYLFKVNYNKVNTPCSSVSIVNCEHVIAGWVIKVGSHNSPPQTNLFKTKIYTHIETISLM